MQPHEVAVGDPEIWSEQEFAERAAKFAADAEQLEAALWNNVAVTRALTKRAREMDPETRERIRPQVLRLTKQIRSAIAPLLSHTPRAESGERCSLLSVRRRGSSRGHRPVVRRARRTARSPGRLADDPPHADVSHAPAAGGVR